MNTKSDIFTETREQIMSELIIFEEVEKRVLTLQGQQVLLDRDVAELYGIETKRVNEAVRNNPDKFPEGYIILLTPEEWSSLRSKFSTLNGSSRGQHVKYIPTAFSEKGLYMLATILKSPTATQTTLAIVETFAKIREFARVVAELYGVETREINQAVKNNPDKFPEGYVVPLSSETKTELVKNFDRFNTLKHSSVMPTAFTEKGLYMLATILKSPTATQTTLAIVETFTKIREFARVVAELPNIKEEADMNTLVQRGGDIFIDILENSIMEVSGDKISIELDLPIVKLKRIIKREKRKQNDSES